MNRIDEMAVAEILSGVDNVLILCHRNPDGDTLGSAFAMLWALKSLGKTAKVDCIDTIPQKYTYMWREDASIYSPEDSKEFHPDFVMSVDVADAKLLGAEYSEKYKNIPLCVDHHVSHVQYADNLCLRVCAANCEIMYDIIRAMGVKITPVIADCLYTGISTDTGCFRYSNVTPQTHRIAADLINFGAKFDEINRVMFETKSKSYFRLQRAVLESVELYFEGKCALITITQDMFRESGSNETECDGIASLPRKIEGALVGVTLRERTDGTFKVSLRSYAPIDASEICKKMGGGGHARAAGCDFGTDLESGKQKILEIIKTEIEKI